MKLVFPGSFDPFTLGHLDIVKRALMFADQIIILILDNKNKNIFLETNIKLKLLTELFEKNNKVKVLYFNGLLTDFLKQNKDYLVLRSVRSEIDLKYERELFYTNQNLDSSFETIFLCSNLKYNYISSTNVRELISFKKYDKLEEFIPNNFINYFKKIK